MHVTPRSRNKLIILDSVVTQNAIIWLAIFPSLRLLCSAAKIAETLLITVKDGNCILFCVKPAEQWSQQKLELLVKDIICMVLSAFEGVKLRIKLHTRLCSVQNPNTDQVRMEGTIFIFRHLCAECVESTRKVRVFSSLSRNSLILRYG